MLCLFEELQRPTSPPRASPAHIAPLVRAPLRKRRGRAYPPFAERKGARGMHLVLADVVDAV